jgi:hypothetical protein
MKYSATAATFALFVSESLGVLLTLAKKVKFLSYRLLKLNAFESRPKMVFGVLMLSLVAFDSESPKILPGVLMLSLVAFDSESPKILPGVLMLSLVAFDSESPKILPGVLMLSLVAFDSESPKILPGVLIPRRTDVANTLDDSRAEPTTAGTTTKRKHLRASRVQDGAHIWFVCLVRPRYFQHGQKVGITQR